MAVATSVVAKRRRGDSGIDGEEKPWWQLLKRKRHNNECEVQRDGLLAAMKAAPDATAASSPYNVVVALQWWLWRWWRLDWMMTALENRREKIICCVY